MKRTRKQRIEYLAVTLAAYVSGACLYSLLALIPHTGDPNFPPVLLLAFFGGLLPSGVVSGVILASGFFSKKSTAFRTTAAFLWFITLACVLYVGIISLIPYGIYNLVKIVTEPKQSSL